MKVADTSFLIALFNADDPRHEHARDLMRATNPVVIGPEVLVETRGVLKAKSGRAAADRALAALFRLANIEWCDEADIVGSYRLYRGQPGLSFVDACVAQLCLRRDAEPLTYDDRLDLFIQRRIASG